MKRLATPLLMVGLLLAFSVPALSGPACDKDKVATTVQATTTAQAATATKTCCSGEKVAADAKCCGSSAAKSAVSDAKSAAAAEAKAVSEAEFANLVCSPKCSTGETSCEGCLKMRTAARAEACAKACATAGKTAECRTKCSGEVKAACCTSVAEGKSCVCPKDGAEKKAESAKKKA